MKVHDPSGQVWRGTPRWVPWSDAAVRILESSHEIELGRPPRSDLRDTT